MNKKEDYLNKKMNGIWGVDVNLGTIDSGKNRKMKIPRAELEHFKN